MKLKCKHNPFGKMASAICRKPRQRLKSLCEGIPQNRRLAVVSALFSILVLCAFFMFGHACYRMGMRKAATQIEISHCGKLPTLIPSAYDDAGMESED